MYQQFMDQALASSADSAFWFSWNRAAYYARFT